MLKATSTTESLSDKKGHMCPPSNATHPSDRWESLFVYAFICKYTQLRSKVEGLDSPMSFEEALLNPEPNPIMLQILSRFILNLRPNTRNLSSDVISSTVASLLQEYFKSSERTVFWNEELRANIDPFHNLNEGFFAADWDFKLKVLRQLVELQLCHCHEIKAIIDRAWGVIHNKHKKAETTSAPPPPGDPQSQEALMFLPIGQDSQRKRYWVVDDSPRLYFSTNPWKITATMHTVSSTREEYIAVIQKLKDSAPKDGERRTKVEQAHISLIKTLDDRLEAIDAELARIQRARKKLEQRNLLIAQADIRETRTRRKTNRPDYAYMNDPDEEDDHDEYKMQEDEEYDDQLEQDDFLSFRDELSASSSRKATAVIGRRRSTRAAAVNGNGKRATSNDDHAEWRGERRSTRLGAPVDTQFDDPATKRARTEESTASAHSVGRRSLSAAPLPPSVGGLKIKIHGAAAVKPTETAVEVVAGKKKSKFWYYAVEPIPSTQSIGNTLYPGDTQSIGASSTNGDHYRGESETTDDPRSVPDTELYAKSIEGSLSPASSMDES